MVKKDYDEIIKILKNNGRKDLIERLKETTGYNNALMLVNIRKFIADDSYAITFQSMAQYRKMLLKAIDDYL